MLEGEGTVTATVPFSAITSRGAYKVRELPAGKAAKGYNVHKNGSQHLSHLTLASVSRLLIYLNLSFLTLSGAITIHLETLMLMI